MNRKLIPLTLAAAAAIAVLVAPPLVAPVQAQTTDATPLYSQSAFSHASGEVVYHAICQGCHMPHGEGAKGAGEYPALAGNPKLAASPYVAMMVLDGHGGMPGFGHMLNDQQVAGVVDYVRTHFGNHFEDKLSVSDVKSLRH